MRKLYTFKEIVSKKKKKESGSSSIAFTEWHVTKIVDFSRWHSTSTMEIWLRYLISTKIFHVPKWIGIDTWPNNIAKSSITSQWQSKFGFAYIPSYTYLYYGSSSIIHIHSFSLVPLQKHKTSIGDKWLPTHWWAVASPPQLSHQSSLLQSPNLPQLLLFLVLVSMPRPALPCRPSGCQVSLGLHTSMARHLGMYKSYTHKSYKLMCHR